MTSQTSSVELLFCRDSFVGGVFRLAGGSVAVFSGAKPGREGPNQDAALVMQLGERRAMLAVADGLGGQPLGHRASDSALWELAHAVATKHDTEEDIRNGILDGVEAANRAVCGMGVGAGTTLAVVEIDGDTARSYHVGDSAILVVGQRGLVKEATTSHSPVGYALESGMMNEEEAIEHEDRHIVSNIVGDPNMRIEIGPTLKLSPRDTVLVASDGVFDNLRQEEAIDLVRKGRLDRVMRTMADTCVQRMGDEGGEHPSKPDDHTFVLYRPWPARQKTPALPEQLLPASLANV